jgi:hypothetical protein
MRLHFGRAFWVILAVAAPVASAGPIIYATGFENPPFTTGAIAGQNGWSVFGPGISSVENTFAQAGSQAVFVDGGTASQSGPYHANTATGIVDVSADIAIFTATTQTEWQFGITGPGLVGFIGGINIMANNQIQLITGSLPIIAATFPRATAFDSTAWHHIDLVLNISAQTYTISLDGSVLGSNLAFCGTNSGPCTGATLAYGDALFDSFGTGNDSAYLDNFSLSNVTAGVPEPSTIFTLAAGLAGIVLAARRKS